MLVCLVQRERPPHESYTVVVGRKGVMIVIDWASRDYCQGNTLVGIDVRLAVSRYIYAAQVTYTTIGVNKVSPMCTQLTAHTGR